MAEQPQAGGTGAADVDWTELRSAAAEIAGRAYAPYSQLHVGAAGLTVDGQVVVGCNVENASYGLTLCAECGLVSDLHQRGAGRLVAVAVSTSDGEKLMPCGRCRQLLYEAGGSALLIDTPDGPQPLGGLLPYAFGPEDLPPQV